MMKYLVVLSVLSLCATPVWGQNVVYNGGFEDTSNPLASWTANADIEPTTTHWLSCDLTLWTVDMNGFGSLSQTFNTVPGVQYTLRFCLSGNPAGPPVIKTMNVNVTGSGGQTLNQQAYTFDTSVITGSDGNYDMHWVEEVSTFCAVSTSSTLTFTSTTGTPNSAFGPVIDNVRVDPNIVVNGGFEDPANHVASWTTNADVEPTTTHWLSCDLTLWTVDMNGFGSLSQTFNTVPGVRYILKFCLSGNPAGPPVIKTMNVNVTGSGGQTLNQQAYTFDSSVITGSDGNYDMHWVEEVSTFIATSATSTITFTSTTGNPNSAHGPVIDNVRIVAAPCMTCCPGDINGDGLINGLDIAGFVALLLAGATCP